jgi:hypothetical protein
MLQPLKEITSAANFKKTAKEVADEKKSIESIFTTI